ncbi:MAG: hypothetical protein JNL82_03105 [Myxococcales bacterium]|nr:hypothetical protein [Myxococcales bacterium]
MGEKRAMTVLGGLLLGGWLLTGCDRGGGGGSAAESEVVDAGAQPLAIGRPADASTGPRVGVVVAATADVRVLPSQGAPFQASEGTMLVKDDRLTTGPGADSFVVVELYNGHVVRFNQSASIVVAGISVFDAPRAGDDLEARFEKVLRPEEQGDTHLRGAISRVAGWSSRMTATETIAALPSPPAAPPPIEALEDIKSGGTEMKGPGDPGPLADSKKASDPKDDPRRPTSPTNPLGGDEPPQPNARDHSPDDGSTTPPEPTKPEPDPKAPEMTPEPKTPEPKKMDPKPEPDADTDSSKPELDLTSTVTFTPDKGVESKEKLPAGLSVGRRKLAECAGAGAKIRARVEKKVIVKIEVVGSGKKCTEGVGRGVDLADGWLELRVEP